MDRAAIFTEITKRNELRRKAQLPLLDVRAEMAHAESLAALQEYHDFCDQHRDKLKKFRADVLAEERLITPDFGHTWGGRFAVGVKARRRFEEWIEKTFGVAKPTCVPKNIIIYGADRGKR